MSNNIVRIAIIDGDKCRPKKCARECKISCPVNQIGKICIEIEEIAKINESMCISCGLCVRKCPFGAIKMVNLPSQLQNNLVYSYGENMFRLYKLPSPKQGKIIGLIGSNGIGKSTIMNILSSTIIPNFDADGKELTKENVLKKIRGSELQKYLKLLYDDKLIVNTKPQDIMTLVNKIKNKSIKVVDILTKFSSSSNYDKVITQLDLDKLFDNQILKLSGGQLQTLVCAVNLLKPGNVYIFDEPTNYLDIEYRIKVANLIKDLCKSDTYIFVVDHDLSILDFVTDYVHIMFGEPGAYGVVSTLYSTLEGINIYFEGYIPADNIRFRAEPYKLNETQQIIEDQGYSSKYGNIEYDDAEIQYDHFNLKINKNVISDATNMIIILGKNGTGKTTYLKHLKDTLGYNISYKSQINSMNYSNAKITVKDLLYDKIRDAMLSVIFVSDVINLLGINQIFDKKVKKLSGGESQRLSIVLCLGTPADIYLIDEPSASLDIEQRFNVTKVIKRFMLHNRKIGFIIEHDILIAISLAKEQSSKVLVFEEIKCVDGTRYCETSPMLDFNIGINKFLKSINATFRTDKTNKRPKLNKFDSVIDREQKQAGAYYQ